MDFRLTEEQEMFRQAVAGFVDQEVIPVAGELDEREEFPWELFRKIARLGWLGIRYPETYGGGEADNMTFNLMCEELARGSLALAATVAMQSLMYSSETFHPRVNFRSRFLGMLVSFQSITIIKIQAVQDHNQ